MKIAISGTNGYIGGKLILELKAAVHEVVILGRNILYDIPALTEKLSGTDTVIHLAGSPILCRWTEANKAEILSSRTETTRNIIGVINQLPDRERPQTFISASAIGIYTLDLHHTEESTSFSDDFVGNVVKQWENASVELTDSVRKVIFRFGLVLGKEAKTMKQLLPLFKLGLGGRIGSGKQAFPFVHIDDVTKAVLWAIMNPEEKGIYNLVAPQNITNEQFTGELSKNLHKPALFVVPEFALKIIYGEAASLILQSPVVYPERLLNSGFKFSYPDIQSCLSEITA
ncbi:MAG TPA: TIGR01777 family oxidoreductase [Prolixibacteraceae bacterium]|nr:TIGR01777 family oxidoreductase [Prolixibacteraceae bacterium]